MTVILILFTILVFLGIDFLLHRPVSAPQTSRALAGESHSHNLFDLPEGLALARNHLWLRKEADGTMTIGLNRFLARTTGTLREILLPTVGTVVTHATADIALRNHEKSLGIQSPVVGRVISVNDAVRHDPDLLRRDPYGSGWLMKIRVFSELDNSSRFLVQHPAEWLKQQFQAAASFLVSQAPVPAMVTMQDGGVIAEGALQEFGADVWKEFGTRFATLDDTSTS